MLKEIKEGQRPTPIILKRQPDTPQELQLEVLLDAPFLVGTITHSLVVLLDPIYLSDCCESICSCNFHHTNEYPQLQEDNTVALTHNFIEGTTIPPYNKQYDTQGWRANQPTRWSLPPQ
ncbi:hypothetical protein PIB30_099722 [Stylosanthes scabra]|uniref:Uncharacterized protein n=1 Tax=Stylosanthes scabra TaxID=79078 RepID=A0ABU6WZH5_9FABA|nr:hypothetical protein [Stylosanthes scabra]